MEKKLEIGYHKYTIDQLPADDKLLVIEAQAALKKAYAKYSGFNVGAAVRLASGRILHGANSESEVFPSGLCAERSLLYFYQSNYYPEPIQTLAIVSDPSPRECYPCGACRQVMIQYQLKSGNPMEIILIGANRIWKFNNVESILPFVFDSI